MRYRVPFHAALLTLPLTVFGCTDDEDDTMEDTMMEDTMMEETDDSGMMADGSIIGVADQAGDFETLLAAVDAAGLTETLQGPGPFTVFAPTDAAFDALPEGTVEALLGDIPALTDILLYHAVAGEVPAADVVEASLIPTVQGSDLKVTVEGDDVMVGGAMVTMTDIMADNGIIHVIDAVMLPPEDIATIAAGNDDFSTLVTALEAADLVETLQGEGPFTVFAPTNAAFDALPEGALEDLLDDIPALTDVLLYHVASDKLDATAVVGSMSIEMANGDSADVAIGSEGPTIAGSPISVIDIPASNGIIHVIDAVMLPE